MTKIKVNKLKTLKYSAFSKVAKLGDQIVNDKRMRFPTFLEVLCSRRKKLTLEKADQKENII
jgi:hypothetical protein